MVRTTHASDAADILRHRLSSEAELDMLVAKERTNSGAARAIFDARVAAGLTQAELARRVGTRQSVISRLEDANYEGHTLSMLTRIANALSREVDVRLIPCAEALHR